MNMRKLILAILSFLPLAISAQIKITFDTDTAEYKSIGVYDTWEDSPFRKGKLNGNAKVIENFTKDKEGSNNQTDNILGVQRSRFGSNTFGVRIDLKEPWKTSETTQYVHVFVNKPYTSKVLLVGLGRRTTSAFTDEPNDVEQFWVESNYSYNHADEWTDMVFPVKTVSGVQIYSLVVVPDLQSPHNYKEDFACYIDQIEINNNGAQRGGMTDYPINFNNQNNSRNDRYLKTIKLAGSDNVDNVNYSQTIAIDQNHGSVKVYTDLTGTVMWDVKPGGTYTPSVVYQGGQMHAYVYIDYNNDGQFTPIVKDNKAADNSEAVSWSGYNDGARPPVYDSKGKQYAGGNFDMPSFTIPSTLAPGIYRMRYKIDWNCIDPGGGNESSKASINMQSTIENGGGIVDILLNVHKDNVTVTAQNRNGYLSAPGIQDLTSGSSIPFRKDFKIISTPAGGFDNDYIVVQHGYNLSGSQYVHHNRQWQSVTYMASEFGDDGSFTIPANIIDGDISLRGEFRPKDYLLLDEATELSTLGNDIYGSVKNVEVHRRLSNTAYNTVVLPFDLTAEQLKNTFGDDAVVYKFSNTNGENIYFTTSADGIKANVPFLMKVNTEESIFRIENVTLAQNSAPVASGTNYDFVGNYGGKITLPEGVWFLSGNKFYRSVGKSTLGGYRAYFKPTAPSGAKANKLNLVIDGITTGISSVINTDIDADADTYNLQGQQMPSNGSLPHGVYIKDAKKVIVK